MDKGKLIELFENAIRTKNSDEVEMAVAEAFSFLESSDYTYYLCELLEFNWHYDHEDIVRLLQQIADPISVEALFKTATKKFDYLDYNDSKPLARKCIWALADIGNIESRNAIIELAKNQDAEIAEYAQKRIDNWNLEIGRKKHYNN